MTNQNNAAQPLLTDDDIDALCDVHDMPPRMVTSFARAIETAVLSKLRAPVADERISLRGAANLAFNALHECKPVKGAEKQYSDAIQALQSALHDIAYTVNRTATPQQFADHLQREARAALAEQPAASAEPVAWIRKNGFRFNADIEPQDDNEIPLYAAPVAAQTSGQDDYITSLRQRIDELLDTNRRQQVQIRTLEARASGKDAEDAARYRMVRRGQHWSVIDGIGDTLRAEALDAAIDAALAHARRAERGGE